MRVIYTKDIYDFISKEFSHYEEAIVLGKGPTFHPIESQKDNVLTIAINESVNQSNYIDMIVVNDMEIYDSINVDKFKTIKYILTPRKIHKDAVPQDNLSYTNVISQIEPFFHGTIIPYNLKSSPIDERYITLETAFSGGNNAADFIAQYLHSIKKVTFFGVGSRVGYCESFKTGDNQHIIDEYTNDKIDAIRNLLLGSLKDKEVIIK